MNGRLMVWGLAWSVALLAGCDKDDAAPANPAPASPAPPAPDVTPKTGGGDAAADAGPSGAPDEVGALTTTTPDPKSVAGKAAKAAADADAASGKMRQATEHLSRTTQHLKDKKPDLARKELEQAESIRDALPESLRATLNEQIKTMRANVDSVAKSENLSPAPDEENK